MALLARADHVEERVVDADGHTDQEDDRLDAVVEREGLADRPEQAESGGDGGQREQHRHERGDDRAEREQQDEQRDRDREQLGAVQVAADDAVARVARGDVARLLDRHLRDGRRRRRAPRSGTHRSRRTARPSPATSAECRSRRDARSRRCRRARAACAPRRRRPPLGTAGSPARQRRRCAGSRTRARAAGPVLVHQRVAACRLADRAVLERLRPGRDPGGRRRARRTRARRRSLATGGACSSARSSRPTSRVECKSTTSRGQWIPDMRSDSPADGLSCVAPDRGSPRARACGNDAPMTCQVISGSGCCSSR